jgi:hypothetical protein
MGDAGQPPAEAVLEGLDEFGMGAPWPGLGSAGGGRLAKAAEPMISILRRTSRDVKRWKSGDMCLRRTVAGMLEAEQQFRKIIGHADLAKLAVAVERDHRRSFAWRPPDHHSRIVTAKFRSAPGIVLAASADGV